MREDGQGGKQAGRHGGVPFPLGRALRVLGQPSARVLPRNADLPSSLPIRLLSLITTRSS